jgi:peptidoglycan/xylan/chitin deacetylase (PgdA/CDA1 family)
MKLRRLLVASIMAVSIGGAAVYAAALADAGMRHAAAPHAVAYSPLSHVSRVPFRAVVNAAAAQVPVLVYHEMDNDCAATAPTCAKGHDYESVTLDQFTTEMQWLYTHGYHSVTLPQYLEWLSSKQTLLPPHPFLITVDNGITDFLQGAQPALYHYRYTATAFLVTGFADGASGQCAPKIDGFNVQPGCPAVNGPDWDATWTQIKALSPAVYGFGIEAGLSGHFVQTYAGSNCYEFDACMMPRESLAHYQNRVQAEMKNGIAALSRELGRRFDAHAWVVPYSDLGYACERVSCSGEQHSDTHGWLVRYADRHFAAAFVQDYYRNGKDNERFRYEVHNVTTIAQFVTAIHHYTRLGAFRWAS